MHTPQHWADLIKQLPAIKHFYVAYSGGIDSHVLLYSLAQTRQQGISLDLTAIHINHAIHPQADDWQQHCQQVCKELDVPYKSITTKVTAATGQSLEAVARDARYAALATIMTKQDCLITAHHQTDQAETFLLQLLRGAGVKGLAAMPTLIEFKQGYLWRPLLNTTRMEIEQYAKQHKLTWIDDSSNKALNFDRNYLRHEVLPLLHKRWPAITETIARSAEHCAEADSLLTELAQMDYQLLKKDDTLLINKLNSLSFSRQRNVMRYWLNQLNLSLPSTVKLTEIQRTVLNCRDDAEPLVTWRGVEVRRYRDQLFAMPPIQFPPHDWQAEWDVSQSLRLPAQLGLLTVERLPQDVRSIFMAGQRQAITVRFRRGGETIKIPGRQGTHDLKKIFQEQGIPPWQRDRTPLIYRGEQLIAVAYEP